MGNFKSTIRQDGTETQVPHGIAIIAAGAGEYEPTEEMLKQGGKAVTKHMVLPADVRSAGVARAVAVYDAMLTAAPEIGDE